jgi:hypothetical protein
MSSTSIGRRSTTSSGSKTDHSTNRSARCRPSSSKLTTMAPTSQRAGPFRNELLSTRPEMNHSLSCHHVGVLSSGVEVSERTFDVRVGRTSRDFLRSLLGWCNFR